MADDRDKLPSTASSNEIDQFLRKLAATPAAPRRADRRGRLIFAMDATASREPTWDRACHIQGQMFKETAALGGLDIQLAYYRGFGEFKAEPWLNNAADLLKRMTGVFCLGGQTQIAKVLRHTVAETKKQKVNALVFVGDCMEEDVDKLCHFAGELGVLGVPVFLFHEGGEPVAARAFKQIARLTNGAYCSFDSRSAKQLRDLLNAVAIFAAGGRNALEDFSRRTGGAALQITHQLNK
ncbi:VWA domain-containing protein [Rhodospirillaceae bacterium SYSU D60014]|uniref:VWA domain-containing protein n=1 Tax=Virgifigura deserti TaxID=2268457 RepID=UPI000E667F72